MTVPVPIPICVAICDDDPDFRALLATRMARDERFLVVAAVATVWELSQVIAAAEVDAVVLDWRLPGIDGPDAVRLVRTRVPGAPICVVSAAPRHVVEPQALAAGASRFVPKDGSVREIAQAVSEHFLAETTLPVDR